MVSLACLVLFVTGITLCSTEYDAALKPSLSAAGFVTRDAREVERKKSVSKLAVASSSPSVNLTIDKSRPMGGFFHLRVVASTIGLLVHLVLLVI